MDQKTLDSYQAHAAELAERYSQVGSGGIARWFDRAFGGLGTILDVGCGSGRDLNTLRQMGFEAVGIDPCQAFLAEAARRYPCTQGYLRQGALPALDNLQAEGFDGVLCSAVLMHLPEEELFDALFALRRVLRPRGRLLLSVPAPSTDPDKQTPESEAIRDERGRLFTPLAPERLIFLLERIGFVLLERETTPDSLGRAERLWVTLLLERSDEGHLRALDRIEAILTQDRKTATYKLALIRALAELATRHHHVGHWRPDGRVGVPLRAVAEKWLDYYWPLLAEKTFIPQIAGEKPGCAKPIAFRPQLQELIRLFAARGGQAVFTTSYRSNTLAPREKNLAEQLLRTIGQTIQKGPVAFAGGSAHREFSYDPPSRCILLAADLWRELALMGHWIIDATLLRWARLSSRMAGDTLLPPSTVLDCLLTTPIPERDVLIARQVYQNLPDKVCVWTGKALNAERYDIDHAIPYSLWHNNDTWNLLPSSPGANTAKRDSLPSRHLLHKRRDCVIHYWEQMRDACETRFIFEASRLAGPLLTPANAHWQNLLFSAFSEAVELTAAHHRAPRWEG